MAKKEETKVVIDSELCILLNNKWELTADSMNYILRRKCNGKYQVEGYYQNIEDVLNVLLDKQIRDTEAKTLRSMLKEIKQIRNELNKFTAEIIKSGEQRHNKSSKKVSQLR